MNGKGSVFHICLLLIELYFLDDSCSLLSSRWGSEQIYQVLFIYRSWSVLFL